MPYAVIKIREIDKKEAGYVHFKSFCGKSWNCNVPELVADLATGERYKIDYNETLPSGGRKYGSKYVNRARLWTEADGPNTWPDKEPYTGGQSTYSGGKSVSKDFDSSTSKRQTAANAAMSWCARNVPTLDELVLVFPVVADAVFQFVDAGGADIGVADAPSDASAIDNDIPF